MSKAIENVKDIIERINRISNGNGKIEIVAATKTRSLEEIYEIINNTQIKVAGENRVQEFIGKYDEKITWDFIGQLQTNKVKYIIDKVRLIHSVDRLPLLETIDTAAKKINKVQNILIEINTAKEESKGGIYFENVLEFAGRVREFENVKLSGIMAVAPLDYGKDELKKCFEKSFLIYQKLKENNKEIKYLSMGMSNDFELAVSCGANLIRLGRAIFGERN